ncbi:hypothetical protein BASA62_002284 [Batrachochytrium salamandrivorans]|nr:hypothetical protein BASA62_002284 [Batrachochytrium salamandrivorans]
MQHPTIKKMLAVQAYITPLRSTSHHSAALRYSNCMACHKLCLPTLQNIGHRSANISNAFGSISNRGLVVLGMSGGVDSTVSALLLKAQGYNVVGVHMRSWDATEELGHCPGEKDWQSVKNICTHILNIPCRQMDFTKEYWTQVFDPFLKDVRNGYTTNPDVQCNQMIKFGAFYERCQRDFQAGFKIAFGHYAQLGTDMNGRAALFKAKDSIKDQTYFLSQVRQHVLQNVLFPIGHLSKREVKQIARENNLEQIANGRESMGICFVGPRSFREFVGEYIQQIPGSFVDEHGTSVGTHKGLSAYTIGQGASIPGTGTKYYVAYKDASTNTIRVVNDQLHPALLCDSVTVGIDGWNWISGCEPEDILTLETDDINAIDRTAGNPISHSGNSQSYRRGLPLTAKFRSRMQPVPVALFKVKDANGNVEYIITFNDRQYSVPEGQDIVVYQENICLGGGRITHTISSFAWKPPTNNPLLSQPLPLKCKL